MRFKVSIFFKYCFISDDNIEISDSIWKYCREYDRYCLNSSIMHTMKLIKFIMMAFLLLVLVTLYFAQITFNALFINPTVIICISVENTPSINSSKTFLDVNSHSNQFAAKG